MKTKLLPSALITFSFLLSPCLAQVPQGFNYQAIARDGSGNPIANATIKIMLSILSDTTGFYSSGSGTYLWEEEQTNVKTNAFGLFTVVFGNPLASKVQGTAVSFSAIDWAKTPLYIGTKIANPTNYKNMGSAKLWSVPYSMVSSGLSGPLKKLGVTGVTTSPDSALFEVKNRNGQTIFAVYNEGVRVYVDDGIAKSSTKGGFAIGGFGTVKSPGQEFFRVTRDSTRIYLNNALGKSTKGGFAIGGFDVVKGVNQNFLTVSDDSVRVYIDTNPVKSVTKGGFAIGGFDQVKAHSQEYLRVTRDSTRVYINNQSGKGATKGGFAIGGFDVVKGGNANYFDVATDATSIISPSQNRVLWYPIKNAFLAGKVLIEKPDSVGVNSFATGYESKAKGQYSQALGYKAVAKGDYSTAIGKNALANKINSFAFGDSSRAINSESYAIGRGAVASGYRSFAFGSAGLDSTGKITDVARALGDYSFAIGQGSQALGKGSFAIGLADTVAGSYSTALGYQTSAKKAYSTAMGYQTTAGGLYSTAIGEWALASGQTSMAMGRGTNATGDISFSTGFASKASGYISTAMGNSATASGWYSTAIGTYPIASGQYSMALGYQTVASNYNSIAIGQYAIASGGYSTSIGCTTTASGDYSTAIGFYSTASGNFSTAMGYFTTAPSGYETVLGSLNTSYTPVSTTDWNSSDRLFVIGNGTNSTGKSNAVTVLKNGYIAIGNISPSQMFDVNGNARFRGVSSGTFGNNLNIMADGTLTTATSDISMKENIYQISDALNLVTKLRGVFFNWKNDLAKSKQIGMIAQEVEQIVPEIVFTNPVDGLKGINYSQASALLVEAIKEQQHEIEGQQQVIEKQQDEINHLKSLENEVSELKTLLNTLIANQTSKGNN